MVEIQDTERNPYRKQGRIIRLSDDQLEALQDGDVVACFNAYSTRQSTGHDYVYIVKDGEDHEPFRTVVDREDATYVNDLLDD